MIKVLLIESREADGPGVEDLLGPVERETFRVLRADSLASGVELLAAEPFDVALLDLGAAGGEGAGELEHLKELAPMLPVVLLCAREERDAAIRAMERGAEDYVEYEHRSGEVLARSILYAIERVDAAARLAFLSRNDPLTGLVNGALFRERVQQALAKSERSGKTGALLILDLDSLDAINEAYGSDAGDLLLQHVGGQLSNAVRPYDVVARLGGDEFGLLLEEIDSAGDAGKVAERILEAIAEPMTVGEREILSTGSVGAAIFPGDGRDPSALLRHAGFALDRAKRQGGDSASFYGDVFGGARGPRLPLSS